MIAYRDFAPRMLEEAGWRKGATYETFDDVLAAANSWIVGESVKVVTVETVVLPNIHSAEGLATKVAELQTFGGHSVAGSSWYQFVRVWYEK